MSRMKREQGKVILYSTSIKDNQAERGKGDGS